jgi:16S rRNA (cytosine1402-N4)-methyltransferase
VHQPVMVEEVIAGLNCQSGKIYVDGTVGQGGHAQAILAASAPTGQVVGLDQDREALEVTALRLLSYRNRVRLYHSCYSDLREVLRQFDITAVAGILLDLGMSSSQLEGSHRGFSFQGDEPLDMRMNPDEQTLTAADILNSYSEADLNKLFWEWGEERWARRIARRVVEVRRQTPFTNAVSLVRLISRAVPGPRSGRRIHPATRVFQALRIAVNRELEKLEDFLPAALGCLEPKGRLVIISYHSLEDRLVKQNFVAMEKTGQMQRLTKKPLVPQEAEVKSNPRARSAKLRVAEKIAESEKLEVKGNRGSAEEDDQ